MSSNSMSSRWSLISNLIGWLACQWSPRWLTLRAKRVGTVQVLDLVVHPNMAPQSATALWAQVDLCFPEVSEIDRPTFGATMDLYSLHIMYIMHIFADLIFVNTLILV